MALGGLLYRIEHVGSTAVPNLAAKPIIDLDIVYSQDADFEEIKTRLSNIGYYHNGDQGIKDREVFKRNGVVENLILDKIKHHLYVCPVNSQSLKRHLVFRDCLRSNEAARLEYQALKYKFAEMVGQDQREYAQLKESTVNDFIDALTGLNYQDQL